MPQVVVPVSLMARTAILPGLTVAVASPLAAGTKQAVFQVDADTVAWALLGGLSVDLEIQRSDDSGVTWVTMIKAGGINNGLGRDGVTLPGATAYLVDANGNSLLPSGCQVRPRLTTNLAGTMGVTMAAS